MELGRKHLEVFTFFESFGCAFRIWFTLKKLHQTLHIFEETHINSSIRNRWMYLYIIITYLEAFSNQICFSKNWKHHWSSPLLSLPLIHIWITGRLLDTALDHQNLPQTCNMPPKCLLSPQQKNPGVCHTQGWAMFLRALSLERNPVGHCYYFLDNLVYLSFPFLTQSSFLINTESLATVGDFRNFAGYFWRSGPVSHNACSITNIINLTLVDSWFNALWYF